MNSWTRLPRGVRDRFSRVLPDWWWVWLHQLREIDVDRTWLGVAYLRHTYPELSARQDDPALATSELRIHSQNGEDGIIASLLHRIGVVNRQVVEFGIGDGTECCSANLVRHFGWTGLLMDGDAANIATAKALYAATPALLAGRLVLLERLVEPANVDDLVAAHVGPDVDLASIDIDGNDYWVWQALRSVRPRLVVIEFNASFGPERAVTIPYSPGFDRYRAHPSGFYYGASLSGLAKLARDKGYVLAGCDSRGVNAFFVREDAAAGVVRDLPPGDAFTSLFERRHVPLEAQFAQIEHLPLVEV